MQTPKTKTFYDWYFSSIYKINRTLHYFAHSWEILSAREDKIRISKRPVTILIYTPWWLSHHLKGNSKQLSMILMLHSSFIIDNISF